MAPTAAPTRRRPCSSLAAPGILQLLLDVLDRDQTLQLVVVIDHQQFFHPVLMQNLLGLLQRGADRNRDQILLGHDLRDGNVGAGLKAQVAIGEDSHQLLALGHRHAADAVASHQVQRIADLALRFDGDRIDDHAALGALHLVDLAGLLLDRQVAVHDSQAALLRQRNRHARFGHRIHGGADQGNVQADVAGELNLGVDFGRNHV